jgi:hypothetical protein
VKRDGQWARFGKQNGRFGMNRKRGERARDHATPIPKRASIRGDSGTVVMEVEIRQEACKNVPA